MSPTANLQRRRRSFAWWSGTLGDTPCFPLTFICVQRVSNLFLGKDLERESREDEDTALEAVKVVASGHWAEYQALHFTGSSLSVIFLWWLSASLFLFSASIFTFC